MSLANFKVKPKRIASASRGFLAATRLSHYNIGWWCKYVRCVAKIQILLPRSVFGYDRIASITGMLFDLEIPSFDTAISNHTLTR